MKTLTEQLAGCNLTEHCQRQIVVAEALSWLGTPHVREARIKGVGVDCAELLAGVFINSGLLEPFAIPHHGALWHLHASREVYLEEIGEYLYPKDSAPLPGDVALFHVKRAYAHGGIVIDWPTKIIHCLHTGGVQWGDASRDAFLIMEQRKWPPKFFTYWKPE